MIVRDRYGGRFQIADQGSGTAQMTSGAVMVQACQGRCVFTGPLVVSCRMVMGVVTRMLGRHTGFVLTIAGHGCPAELQGQQHQQEDRQVPFHGREL